MKKSEEAIRAEKAWRNCDVGAEHSAEFMDVYDWSGRKTGKIIPRRKQMELGDNEYVHVVQIAVFRSNGDMLIQRRQKNKSWGGLWDISASGGMLAGEDSRQSAHRELLEELGIDEDFSEEVPRAVVNYGAGFTEAYVIHRDVEPGELTLQEEEVMDARWAGLDEILEMMKRGEFVPYIPGWVHYLFGLQDNVGNLRTDRSHLRKRGTENEPQAPKET